MPDDDVLNRLLGQRADDPGDPETIARTMQRQSPAAPISPNLVNPPSSTFGLDQPQSSSREAFAQITGTSRSTADANRAFEESRRLRTNPTAADDAFDIINRTGAETPEMLAARDRANRASSSVDHGGNWWTRHAAPLVSSAANFMDQREYGQAQENIRSGRADRNDYDLVATMDRRHQLESSGTEQLASAAAGIPAVLGEFYLGGRILGAAGNLPGRAGHFFRWLAPSAEAAAAETWPGYVGRTTVRSAVMTPLIPSTYLENAAERNVQAGRPATDPRGFGEAYTLAVVNNAVLGSASEGASNIPGTALTDRLTRNLARVGIGMGEQQVADIVTGFGTEHFTSQPTGYGILGDVLAGRNDDAWRRVMVQGLTFGIFAGMHEARGREGPLAIADANLEAGRALHAQGLSRQAATDKIAEVHGRIINAMLQDPDLTQAQARALFSDDPAGPLRTLGETLSGALQAMPRAQGPVQPRQGQPSTEPTPEAQEQAQEAGQPAQPAQTAPEAVQQPPSQPETPQNAPGQAITANVQTPTEGREVAPTAAPGGREPTLAELTARHMELQMRAAGEVFARMQPEEFKAAVDDLRAQGFVKGRVKIDTVAKLVDELRRNGFPDQLIRHLESTLADYQEARPEHKAEAEALRKEILKTLMEAKNDDIDPVNASERRRGNSEAPFRRALEQRLSQAPEAAEARDANAGTAGSAGGPGPDQTAPALRGPAAPDVVTPQPGGSPRGQFDEQRIASLAQIKPTSDRLAVGTLGDFITGEQTRKLYEKVLDTPVLFTDAPVSIKTADGSMQQAPPGVHVPGAAGSTIDAATGERKPAIVISGTRDPALIRHILLEEGAHVLREQLGRTLTPVDFGKSTAELRALPSEVTADRMTEYAKTLDKFEATGAHLTGAARDNIKIAASSELSPGKPVTPPTPETLLKKAKTFSTSLWDRVQELGQASHPKTTRLSEAAGEAMNRNSAAKIHAQLLGEHLIDEVFGPKGTTDAEDRLAGLVRAEQRLRYMRNAYERRANEIGREADAAKATGDKEKEARLTAQHAEAFNAEMNVRTLVGGKDSPVATEAEYQRALHDSRIQELLSKTKDNVAPIMEENYRGATGLPDDEDIHSFTQEPGNPVNLIRSREGDKAVATAIPLKRGEPTNPRQRALGFAKQATGSSEAYDISLRNQIMRSIADSGKVARQAEMNRVLVAEGVAQWVKPGERPDGYRVFKEVNPPLRSQENERGSTALAVRNEAASEYAQSIELDKPWGRVWLAGALTQANLSSALDALSHIKNLMTINFKAGVIPVYDQLKNIYKIMAGDRQASATLVELARINAMKEKGLEGGNLWGGKYDPTMWLGKMMDVVQNATRLTANDAFDRLARRGSQQDTETARRDFINQHTGNYNKRSQNPVVVILRDTGLGPFATAATTFISDSIRTVFMSSGGRSASLAHDLGMRAEMLLKIATFAAAAPLINYMLWKRIDGDDNTPIGAIKMGENKNGKTPYFDLLALTGFTRGAKILGLSALAEGSRQAAHATGNDIVHQATAESLRGALHPFEGPPVAFGYTTLTGKDTMGRQVARTAISHRQNQEWMNVQAALWQANPILDSMIRPYVEQSLGQTRRHERPLEDRAWSMLGPYGVHQSAQPPGRPRRERP